MAVLDRLFPTGCVGCGATGGLVCARCRRVLAGPPTPARPRPSPRGLPPTWSVADYTDPIRPLLIAYKEHGAVGLRRLLAIPLATAVRAASPVQARAPVVLVPVPSSARAVRTRGDDVVLGLARVAASLLRRGGGRVTVVPALRHVRAVADSAGLSATGRTANLAGAFAIRAPRRGALLGATVLLVDDLITTGASLAEAAAALRAGGVNVRGAATVAATQRRT